MLFRIHIITHYQHAVIIKILYETVGDFKCRSQWLCILKCRSTVAGFLGAVVLNPAGGMDICLV
jgi:hypothetical protein